MLVESGVTSACWPTATSPMSATGDVGGQLVGRTGADDHDLRRTGGADPAVTESPAAMDTEATVPEMVLTRLAPASACWASVRLAWAVSIEAWSTATCWGVAFLVDARSVGGAGRPGRTRVSAGRGRPTDVHRAWIVAESDRARGRAPADRTGTRGRWRAAVRALSSWSTCLMSAATWPGPRWPGRAPPSRWWAPPPPEPGVVVEVVVDVVGGRRAHRPWWPAGGRAGLDRVGVHLGLGRGQGRPAAGDLIGLPE